MTLKRLKQLVIGGPVLVALALGGSASAGAATAHAPRPSAHDITEKTLTADPAAKASAAPLVSGRGRPADAMSHIRDSWIHDLYLTDHEQYVRHHERLASGQ
ncbi:MAG TPA: hypothetical protein VKG38_01550 [Solirubrobacteraceae bacterium]|nr:hypothetical protein [Solirubrobacteraceae bacterium]